jgi:2'-5' RNA ligase
MADMTCHWWWRPGWQPGRRMYAWHVTFAGARRMQDLAAAARERLAGLPGLDLVPGRLLHLTTQDVGFTDEVGGTDLETIISAARARLAAVPAPTVTLGPARVVAEGVCCDAEPRGALTPARDAVRAAIADVRGPHRVPGDAQWWPHVSLAYANAGRPAAPIEAALAGLDAVAAVGVTEIQLIRLGRDRRLYEWETLASVRLGSARHRRT